VGHVLVVWLPMSYDDSGKTRGAPIDKLSLGVHGSKKAARRTRPVIVVPKDGGELRQVSSEELIAGLVKKTAVELAGLRGYRQCEYASCARMVKQPRKGRTKCCPEHTKAVIRDRAKLRQQRMEVRAAKAADSRKRYLRRRAEDPDAVREEGRRLAAQYLAANREQCNAKRRARRRRDPNREANLELRRATYAANSKKELARSARYRDGNREKLRTADRARAEKAKAERRASTVYTCAICASQWSPAGRIPTRTPKYCGQKCAHEAERIASAKRRAAAKKKP